MYFSVYHAKVLGPQCNAWHREQPNLCCFFGVLKSKTQRTTREGHRSGSSKHLNARHGLLDKLNTSGHGSFTHGLPHAARWKVKKTV